MKVLLFTAPSGRPELPKFPLGLAYVAAALKKHSIKIFDFDIVDKAFKGIHEIIQEEKPDIVGISLCYIDTSSSYDKFSYYPSFVSCVKNIKRIKNDVTVIIGGSGFTLFAKQVMEAVTDIDFGVLFEGEETFCDLLDNLNNPQRVKGICYRSNARVHFTDRRRFLDFDDLPPPKRDIVDINRYKYFHEQMGIQTKRGCVFKCIYCTYPYLGGNQIRARSPQKVVDEIEGLAKFGIKKIFITDSIFNYPQEHALKICQEIVRRGITIKWKAFFNERFMDQKLFLCAKEAGCEVFIFGPDGSNPMALKSLKKIFSYPQMVTVYRLFKKSSKVHFKCVFMFNNISETIKTILNTLRLIITLFLKGNFQFSVGNMRIYPYTELFDISFKKGIIKKDTNLIYPHYYDPFPFKIGSYFLNYIGSFIYTKIRLKQSKVVNFKPKSP